MDIIEKLGQWFQPFNAVYVAFSGGLDSSTLLAAAKVVCSRNFRSENRPVTTPPVTTAPITAVYTSGPLAPRQERGEVERIAAEIGVPLVVLQAHEEELPEFIQNDPFRCYYCKKQKLSCVLDWLESQNKEAESAPKSRISASTILIDGSNADDQNDWRPGSRAKEELGIRSPFAELGITKPEIRDLARTLNLSVAQKPSSPCLASRIAYGLSITAQRLEQIDVAEEKLHALGFDIARFRILTPRTAQIEVAPERVAEFIELDAKTGITCSLAKLGFEQVTVDPDGFASGKLNQRIQLPPKPSK